MGSNRQESVRLRRDLGGVLEQEAVCRVGIDLHPGIGDEAGQQVAELGRDHQVAVTLDDQRRALDPSQPLQPGVVRDTPLDDRVVLRVARGVARRGVASLLALDEAPEELHSLGLAGLGVREHYVEEVLWLALAAGGGGDVVAPAVHARRALRASRRQHKPSDERRPHQCDLLRDEPADREPEQVDLGEAERVRERDHLAGTRRDRPTRLARGGPDAGVVDQDDLALRRQARRSAQGPSCPGCRGSAAALRTARLMNARSGGTRSSMPAASTNCVAAVLWVAEAVTMICSVMTIPSRSRRGRSRRTPRALPPRRSGRRQ
jgi:hypothetical protein